MRYPIASTLSILTLLAAPTISHALTCAPRHFTLSEAYEAADSVIVGLITGCKEEISRKPWAGGGSDCSFIDTEVLKESAPGHDYSGVVSSSGCGLSLRVGEQYLLFLDNENRPLRFSATLGGDQYPAQLSNQYLQIIRDFKNGKVDDLAEPWMFAESDGSCSLSQNVRGNQIRFSRRTADAPQQPKANWIEDTIDGVAVYKTNAPSFRADSKLPTGNVEVIVFGDIYDSADDALMLNVTLLERPTAPIRQTTFSVNDKTWLLNRMEINLSLSATFTHKVVQYYGGRNAAEQILSALAKPSDIVVSSTLVASSTHTNSALSAVPPTNQDYLGVVPKTRSTRPTVAPNVNATGSYGTHGEPPQLALQVESRSTQLPGVIQDFLACSAGDEQ